MKQAKWYVYELVDPRDGAVFYVGKGSGNRIHQHEKDAANAQTVCSKKHRRIKEIWAAGLQVQRRHHALFWDEQAAYDHETDLIEDIGLDRLTNVLPGGQKAWDRRRQERAARKVDPLHLMLAKKETSALMARLAEWLKVGGHNGVRVQITARDPLWKVTAQVSQVFYNDVMPSLWRQIVADAKALDVVRSGVRRYGVELV